MHLVPEQANGQRLDNYLYALFRDVPRSRVLKAIRKGEVRVNGGRVSHFQKLNAGDTLRIPPFVRLVTRMERAVVVTKKNRMPWEIVYEDHCVLIINKPADTPVHSGSDHLTGVIESINAHNDAEHSFYLAHRLDSPVSGCLLIAKSRIVLNRMLEKWNDAEAQKHYQAVVVGRLPQSSFIINSDLPEFRAGRAKNQKPCVTRVTQLPSASTELGYCDIYIETGRKHQIRRHLQSVALPILGDGQYGNFHANTKWLGRARKKSLFLHCKSLRFFHPERGWLTAQAPWPMEKQAFLQTHVLIKT